MEPLPTPEEFKISGFEDVTIFGNYFAVSDTTRCVIIFAHGWGRNWPNMLKYYPMVEDCECNLVMYDHRSHGASERVYPTGGIKEAKDLIAVTEWVSQQKGYDWDQIAWFGSSWGATTALMAGAQGKDPAFIVADAPFQAWYSAIFERALEDSGSGITYIAPGVMQVVNSRSGINYKEASAREAVKKIEEPVLLIHSEADPETSSNQSINISKNLNDKSEFHLTKWGNKHVMDVINNKDEMKALFNNFVEKNKFENFKVSNSGSGNLAINESFD